MLTWEVTVWLHLADLKLDQVAWRAIEAAFHEHAVLVFPQQQLSADEQIAFAKRFGEIETLTPNPELKAVPISNLKLDGTTRDADEDFTQILRGNEQLTLTVVLTDRPET